MAKLLATIKAIITRLVFGAHGFIAIWQVTQFKKNPRFWYLSCPILLLFFEGVFTLTIKDNQEWKWFCPSVFLYLGSVVPAIWLLELDKVDRRLRVREETFNLSAAAGADLRDLDKLLGVQIRLPEIQLSAETWVTLIEQFLMLTLIVGRWMLPKGDLTRDQLSQLLLVYIGTAADIIEFFDSFKDATVASEPLLVFLTLAIWSWSLLQFTVVLSATRARQPRGAAGGSRRMSPQRSSGGCCSIDAWGIALNIVLQDAPFLAFRLLIIAHYRIISYMNVFFTCKNTLVILLQLYRLYVVHVESRDNRRKDAKNRKKHQVYNSRDFELSDISVISGRIVDGVSGNKSNLARKQRRHKMADTTREGRNNKRARRHDDDDQLSEIESDVYERQNNERSLRHAVSTRKDTGYSTASSHTDEKPRTKIPPKKPPRLSRQLVNDEDIENQSPIRKPRLKKPRRDHEIDITEEETESDDVEKRDKRSIEKSGKISGKHTSRPVKQSAKRLAVVYSSGDSSD